MKHPAREVLPAVLVATGGAAFAAWLWQAPPAQLARLSGPMMILATVGLLGLVPVAIRMSVASGHSGDGGGGRHPDGPYVGMPTPDPVEAELQRLIEETSATSSGARGRSFG